MDDRAIQSTTNIRPTRGTEDDARASSSTALALPPATGQLVRAVHKRKTARRPSRKQRSFLARTVMTGVRIMVPVILLLAIAVGLLLARLNHGPISLTWLSQPISQGLAAQFPGMDVGFEDITLSLAEDDRPELSIRNLVFRDDRGQPVAHAANASIALSLSAIKRGELAPERIALIRPTVLVFYDERDGFSLKLETDAPATVGRTAAFSEGTGGSARSSVATPTSAARRETGQRDPAATQLPAADVNGQIDLVRLLNAVLFRDARQMAAVADLKAFGLKGATVVIDRRGSQTIVPVSRFDLQISHDADRRRVLRGDADVAHGEGWSLAFEVRPRAEQTPSAGFLINASVRGINPADVIAGPAGSGGGPSLDMPLSGTLTAGLAATGGIDEIQAIVDGQKGLLRGPDGATLTTVQKLHLDARLSPERGRLDIGPSTVMWEGHRVTFVGSATRPRLRSQAGAELPWQINLSSTDARLAPHADDARRDVIAVEQLSVQAALRDDGGVDVRRAVLGVDGGVATVAGRYDGVASSQTRLISELDGLPARALIALWPARLQPTNRAWLARHLNSGRLTSGRFALSATEAAATDSGARARPPGDAPQFPFALEGAMQVTEVTLRPADGLPIAVAPTTTFQMSGDTISVTAPEATFRDDALTGLKLTALSYRSERIWSAAPTSAVAFSVSAPVSVVRTMLARPAIGMAADAFRGRIEGQVTGPINIAFTEPSGTVRATPLVTGRLEIANAGLSHPDLRHPLTNGTVTIELAERVVDISGDIEVAQVPAQLNWQVFRSASAGEDQPPLRLTMTLDDAARARLGMQTGNLLRGATGAELSISNPFGEMARHVRINLSEAVVDIDSLGWTKPPGRKAIVDFDVVPAAAGVRLSNLRVVGDGIAIQGSAEIGADGQLSAFAFPQFTLDLVSRLEVRGTRTGGRDGVPPVWSVDASGPTYDGRPFFRDLFSVSERPEDLRNADLGLDLTARIETVIGFNDTRLKKLRVSLRKRRGRLEAFEAIGLVDDKEPLTVGLQVSPNGQRRMVATSRDAGGAFRLVDFYPSVRGGRLELVVDLDGPRPAVRDGNLSLRRFEILGDPVVAEVISSNDPQRPAIAGGRGQRVVREVLQFNSMDAPFSFGHGQFVLHDAQLRGPLVGGTLRGKADFGEKTLDLGGTYAMLQELNAMPSFLPGLGQILTGSRGEGFWALNFAIQGPMQKPEVLVHPLSALAPGIIRDIFTLSPLSPRVTPRTSAGAQRRPGDRDGAAGSATETPKIMGDWQTQTRPRFDGFIVDGK